MSYKVKATPYFEEELNRIAKKHKEIKSGIAELIDNLETDPMLATHLGQNIYKIRLAIAGTNKGKSGGVRIITYVLVVDKVVYLSEIYLKNEYATVDVNVIVMRLKNQQIIN